MDKSHRNGSKTHRVLVALKANGTMTNGELNDISHRFGEILRILRREGHEIVTTCVDHNAGYYTYTLKRPKNKRDGLQYEFLESERKGNWLISKIKVLRK